MTPFHTRRVRLGWLTVAYVAALALVAVAMAWNWWL